MNSLASFHHPYVSLFQSAVDAVVRRTEPIPAGQRPGTDHPLVAATAALGQSIVAGPPPGAASADAPPEAVVRGGAGVMVECAKLAWELAWATISGNAERQLQLAGDLEDAKCDPRWIEAVTQFVEYFYASGRNIPYRTWRSLDDFVIDGRLPGNATVAFLADWGTGMPPAIEVLAQVAAHQPDVLIHLGDIYYAGTVEESRDHFLTLCRAQSGLEHSALFTLAGNHDMYSGGNGYYGLLDEIGQPASFFCLRNDHWQFQTMDTGYHDHVPTPFPHTQTYVEPSEVEWHRARFEQAAGRKIVLMSHHQLFSAFDDRVGPEGVNPKLLDAFGPNLPQVTLWLWGHEHKLAKYSPYLGLERGRCIGCGALPQFADDGIYDVKYPDVPWDETARLKVDSDGVYYHGYALMKLNGPAAAVTYYEARNPARAIWFDAL